MKDQDTGIEELIEELRIMQMCKDYSHELRQSIQLKTRKIGALDKKAHDLNDKTTEFENNKLEKFFKSFRPKKEKQYQLEKKEYFKILNQLGEEEKLIQLLEFELKTLEEKLTKENQLKEQLRKLIFEREQKIKKSNSKHLKKILRIIQALDNKRSAQKEVIEILDEGERVIKIVDSILLNINHKLVKTYNTDKESLSYSTVSNNTIEEIQKLSIKLRKALLEFKEELKDVYDDKKAKLIFKHQRRDYFNTISYGELIVSQLLRKDIARDQKGALKKIAKDIHSINMIFLEELKVINLEIDDLKEEKLIFFKT